MSKILTVKQISNYISGVFEDELILHDISVTGEIFEFKISGSNTFIVLKEDDVILECYRFGSLGDFKKGDKVTARGRIKYYPKGAKVSLYITEIHRSGLGQHHAEFLKLKERLQTEGLFDNKLSLPIFIKKAAIVTSAEGAVIHDFLSVIEPSHGYIDVEVFNVSVQGATASLEITSAIKEANKRADIDVIVIARGGGSYQDLLPFNSEEIARAVFNSKIPVISAVGHETDYTLCDFCSSLRAPTPSLAAECIAKINQGWFDRMLGLLARGAKKLTSRHNEAQALLTTRLAKLAARTEAAFKRIENRVTAKLVNAKMALDKRVAREESNLYKQALKMSTLIKSNYDQIEKRFCILSAKLDALSPLRLMSGGYARVLENGRLIKSAHDISADQTIKVAFHDGTILAKVLPKTEE